MEIRKLIKDGKVGVILAKTFDIEGWYTAHKHLQLLFLPELISLIESDEYKNANDQHQLVHELLTNMGIWDFSCGNGLFVDWIPIGTQFKVETRPCILRGYENEIIMTNDDNWITA